MATNFRFWRIRFQESMIGSTSDIYVGGLALRAVAGGPNLTLTNPTTRGVEMAQYPVASLIDNSATSTYGTFPNGWATVELPSEVDIAEIAITASVQWYAFAPKRIEIMGGWTADAFLKVADYTFTSGWTAGQTRTVAIPAYAFEKNFQWIEQAHVVTSFDAVGDGEVTVGKGLGYGVADQDHFALSKAISYGLVDNRTNGVAKAVAYAILEEAPVPGQVDGFRMRNAIGRNVVMRGGKGEPPPPPPVHYPEGQIPQEPQ